MSLKEKLSSLSKNLEEENSKEEKLKADKQLEPVRANIKTLEAIRWDLDLLKGSLDFKASDKSEESALMQDYAKQTSKKIEMSTNELDSLISENKEALMKLGVENREQLAVHPEFANDEEVINYKGSLDQGEGLKMSDAKLKERLTNLGVEFNIENFSYESASQAIEKKIANIDGELIQERLKTPEGREMTINSLAEEFKKNTGKMELNSSSVGDKLTEPVYGKLADRYYNNKSDSSYDFGTERDNFRINFKDEKASVNNWSRLKLIPDNFEDTEVTYGKDITQQALEKTYKDKVHNSFVQWDERGDKAISLKEQIKAVSPEENNKAREKMHEAIKKLNEILLLLQKKSDELKEKGIELNPEYYHGYGPYKEIICLNDSVSAAKYINENLNDNFPPHYDATKLQEASSKLIGWTEKFAEVINNLETKEDVDNFLLHKKNLGATFNKKSEKEESVGESFHGHFLSCQLETQKYEFELKGNKYGAVSKLIDKCKTYQQAEDYLNKIIDQNVAGEKRVSETIIDTIKAHLKLRELETEIKQEKIGERIYDLERKIEKIAVDKEGAIKAMGKIESLQSELSREPELSKENLILSDSHLIIPSIKKEYDDLRENKPLKQKEWENKKTERERQEETKPGLFGKEKWQKKLDLLKGEEASAEIEYRALDKQDQNSLYYKAYRLIDSDSYTTIGKIVQSHKAQGNASEIFNSLREELTKVIDTTLPPKILQDYAEYKALVEKIG